MLWAGEIVYPREELVIAYSVPSGQLLKHMPYCIYIVRGGVGGLRGHKFEEKQDRVGIYGRGWKKEREREKKKL